MTGRSLAARGGLVLGSLAQTTLYGALLTAVLLAVLACPRVATAQTVALGDVELTVGPVGADGLYGSGAVVESFPGALFADGQARAVASVIEDADGVWTLSYTGGRTDDWRPAAELDDVVITAEYADGVDSREFVLGGFVESAQGRALQLTPPIPGGGRDWEARSSELVTLSFSRRVAAAAPTTPPPLVAPVAEPDSFVEWLAETTPGGPVMVQALITVIVFVGFMLTVPATPWGLLLGAVVLITTPWLPVVFGFGSTIAASIVAINVLAGAFTYKAWVGRTEV